MTAPGSGRRLLLRGPAEALRKALDRCYFLSDVRGVREAEGEIELALAAPLDDVSGLEENAAGLAVHVLPDDVEVPTGLEDDEPVWIGDRILVRPPWVPRPSGRDLETVTELVVPRGGAFGSGEHGSTQAALLALDAAWPSVGVDVFCDVGTGSGILALYASRRGAAAIAGCDVDPAAVRAANELVPAGRFAVGGPVALRGLHADCVVANLTADEHAGCLADVVALWSGRGPLVLSGTRVGDEVEQLEARLRALRPSLGAAVPRHECSGFVASVFGA